MQIDQFVPILYLIDEEFSYRILNGVVTSDVFLPLIRLLIDDTIVEQHRCYITVQYLLQYQCLNLAWIHTLLSIVVPDVSLQLLDLIVLVDNVL